MTGIDLMWSKDVLSEASKGSVKETPWKSLAQLTRMALSGCDKGHCRMTGAFPIPNMHVRLKWKAENFCLQSTLACQVLKLFPLHELIVFEPTCVHLARWASMRYFPSFCLSVRLSQFAGPTLRTSWWIFIGPIFTGTCRISISPMQDDVPLGGWTVIKELYCI